MSQLWEEDDVNYVEFDDSEEMLMIAKQENTTTQAVDEVWFLDYGCSSHMV